MSFDDPFSFAIFPNADTYNGPPPGQRTNWYDSEHQVVGMSPAQRAAARRALGLDGGSRRQRPANGLAAFWASEREKIKKHIAGYINGPVFLRPPGYDLPGFRSGLDYHPQSADNECAHGRLRGDRCPQPQLKSSAFASGKVPRRLWPFDLPCWCWGEEGALRPETVGPGYGGVPHMRSQLSHDAVDEPGRDYSDVERRAA